MKQQKIIVLGATGHLGANTTIALKNENYDVVAVGHRESDNGFFTTKGINYIGNFSLEDELSYQSLPTDAFAIIHLAGTMPAHADKNPMPYVKSIIVGMVNLCEWLKCTRCRRVIFNTTPSDIVAHFGTTIPVQDDALRSFPKNGGDHAVYAIAKNAAIDILEHYKYACGISSCIFRHLTVYGYHPNPYYFINGIKKKLPWRIIMERAIKGLPVEIWGDPNRKKELLYIKDFTQAVLKAIETGAEGIFNISGYEPYTLEEQIKGIVSVFSPKDNPSEIVFCPEKPDTPQNLLDSTKARSVLGWTPKFDWVKACEDIKKEMNENPYGKLWGVSHNCI